jgi:hypothetical protein
MTDEHINKAIAEFLGWDDVEIVDTSGRWNDTVPQRLRPIGIPPTWKNKPFIYKTECPEWHTDLNAMHVALKSLDGEQFHDYGFNLVEVLDEDAGDGPCPYSWQATARQQAEAFLRTVGKWEEQA